ncbi:uncharacterized protein LOC144915835 [Branchiostoma floridae x Branchiostoma belcheri]
MSTLRNISSFRCVKDGWKTLDLSNQNLLVIPPAIFEHVDLERLDLQDNNICTAVVPREAANLASLVILDLGNNTNLGHLPRQIGLLAKLRELRVQRCGIEKLPEELYNLQTLEVLVAPGNKITTLSEEIDRLYNLKEIWLGENELESLPGTLCVLSNLHTLSLYKNKLSSLPPGIANLQTLKLLSIQSNRFTALPGDICKLCNLQVLHVGDNVIHELPENITKLTKLRVLSISASHFKVFPAQVLHLWALEELYMGRWSGPGRRSFVPKDIAMLRNLKRLAVDVCGLESLPDGVGALTHLEYLSLSYNRLSYLPPQILTLTNLKVLKLKNNGITSLPSAMHRLANIEQIDVSGNPLTYPPAEVLNGGVAAIMAFLTEEARLERIRREKEDREFSQLMNALSADVDRAEWRWIGRELGLTDLELHAIQEDAQDNVQEQTYKVLMTWREQAGECATLDRLVEHLRSIRLHHLAEALQDMREKRHLADPVL